MLNIDRNELLLGKNIVDVIANSTILIAGLGGVGSFSCEAAARLGFGTIIIVDHDIYEPTNLNRQLGALNSTIGQSKVSIMASRINDINPKIKVVPLKEFYNRETFSLLKDYKIDYAIDAIDSLPSKWQLIKDCLNNNIIFISSGGMAGTVSSEQIKIMPLSKTTYDPISKVLRRLAKEEKIDARLIPMSISCEPNEKQHNSGVLPSVIFAPAISGLKCVEYIVKKIIEITPD